MEPISSRPLDQQYYMLSTIDGSSMIFMFTLYRQS